jgi:DNA-binding NarL/FixJ family response regulator
MLDNHSGTDRLILVSDDPAASEALAVHLTRHGFVLVGQVRSAEAARIAARYTEPDVVLVDAAISGGWRAVVEALDGVLESGRIAVLASYWGADERQEAAESGIGAAILKAVEGGALALRLREIAAHA